MDLEDNPHLKDIIDNTFFERFKNFRHTCHVNYKTIVAKGLNPLDNNPYPYVKDEDWKWMCTECFQSETWKVNFYIYMEFDMSLI